MQVDAKSVREGKIPEGVDNAVVDEKTGKVIVKQSSTKPGLTSWDKKANGGK